MRKFNFIRILFTSIFITTIFIANNWQEVKQLKIRTA